MVLSQGWLIQTSGRSCGGLGGWAFWEALGVGFEGRPERLSAGSGLRWHEPMVDVGGGHQPEPDVVVLVVVPGEKSRQWT